MEPCRKNNQQGDYMYENAVIQSNIRAVEFKLKFVSSDLVFQNITDKKLAIAADMFLYLNSCTFELMSLVQFFNDLFMNQNPDLIILTLNRILKIKESPATKGLIRVVQALLKNVTKLFSRKYQRIENMTWEGMGNLGKNGGNIYIILVFF